MLPEFGRYTTPRPLDKVSAMSLAASIFRKSMKAGPDRRVASLMSLAASLSPSARMMAPLRSCSAFITTNLARSASCSATCFISTAFMNSEPNDKCVMATSSNTMPKSAARFNNAFRTVNDTFSRCVRSCSALNWATVAFTISFPMDGSTLSSQSTPKPFQIKGSLSSSGLDSILKDMFTICKSLVPVTELMTLGLVRMSMMWGTCTQGILKCVPSPLVSSSTPLKRSKMTARSPPSTV
mmetsp:Transcript_28873/g.77775  ORF Transcript_28873/g.77775 Transcript_28873/m.77775 type:complete len:239 (-) Transcript_28873:228-944(-)